jgi:hypothetical protein
MRRQIKLMWDYGCWPTWQQDGQIFINVDPATLALSTSTQAQLKAWAAIPDAKLAAVEHPPDITWTADEKQAFEAEGRELWRLLQRELAPDFVVSYHSTTERRVSLPEDDNAG